MSPLPDRHTWHQYRDGPSGSRGDVIEIEIEGIGTLRNPIQDETA